MAEMIVKSVAGRMVVRNGPWMMCCGPHGVIEIWVATEDAKEIRVGNASQPTPANGSLMRPYLLLTELEAQNMYARLVLAEKDAVPRFLLKRTIDGADEYMQASGGHATGGPRSTAWTGSLEDARTLQRTYARAGHRGVWFIYSTDDETKMVDPS